MYDISSLDGQTFTDGHGKHAFIGFHDVQVRCLHARDMCAVFNIHSNMKPCNLMVEYGECQCQCKKSFV